MTLVCDARRGLKDKIGGSLVVSGNAEGAGVEKRGTSIRPLFNML